MHVQCFPTHLEMVGESESENTSSHICKEDLTFANPRMTLAQLAITLATTILPQR